MKTLITKLQRLRTHIHNLTRAPTIEEVIAYDTEKALLTQQQAQRVIDSHEYIRHMAKAKLAAIDEYRKGNML